MKKILTLFKNRSISFYIFLAICIISFIAQCVFVYAPARTSPTLRQTQAFKEYWETEGAAKFKAVGLEPTEELFQEELNRHLEKTLATEPETDPDLRILQLKKTFSTWWENEGNRLYTKNGELPDKATYKREERRFLNEYKASKTIYSIRLDTTEPSASQMLLHWILFSSFFLFLLNTCGLLFASDYMEKRFGLHITLALFVGSIFLGGLLLSGLGQTRFFSNVETPYSGMFLATSLCLGSICFSKNKLEFDKIKVTLATVIYLASVVCAWVYCPRIYVAAIVISVILFLGGILLGKMLPERKKSKAEIAKEKAKEFAEKPKEDPKVARMKATRTLLMEGLESAMRGDFNLAKEKIASGMHALLLETPLDIETLTDFAKKITNPNLYIDISSSEWQEWGMASFQKKANEAAIYLLDKSLTLEKEEANARKSLLYVGGIRLRLNIIPEEGVKRLEKVIALKDGDLFAEQAKKLLEKYAPKKEQTPAIKKAEEKPDNTPVENGLFKAPKKLSDYVEEENETPVETHENPKSVQTSRPSPFRR